MKRITCMTLAVIICAFAFSGCQSFQNASTTSIGTAIGALGGAGIGAIAGNNIRGISGTEGAVAGALVGGLLGHVTGKQKDVSNSQQAQINQLQVQQNQKIVNISNSNGSVTPVVLHRVGAQWQGPRGEFYTTMPTPEQLAPVYGL